MVKKACRGVQEEKAEIERSLSSCRQALEDQNRRLVEIMAENTEKDQRTASFQALARRSQQEYKELEKRKASSEAILGEEREIFEHSVEESLEQRKSLEEQSARQQEKIRKVRALTLSLIMQPCGSPERDSPLLANELSSPFPPFPFSIG